jgi:hypothetical protein
LELAGLSPLVLATGVFSVSTVLAGGPAVPMDSVFLLTPWVVSGSDCSTWLYVNGSEKFSEAGLKSITRFLFFHFYKNHFIGGLSR